jgi:signal transduction histidine kinase
MESSLEIVVYRIVQELLNNVVKHSGAAIILVQVMKQEHNLTITVEDNGKGFNKDEVLLMKGTGLKNIQARVDYLKGQLDIKSTPGKGTSVHIDCII